MWTLALRGHSQLGGPEDLTTPELPEDDHDEFGSDRSLTYKDQSWSKCFALNWQQWNQGDNNIIKVYLNLHLSGPNKIIFNLLFFHKKGVTRWKITETHITDKIKKTGFILLLDFRSGNLGRWDGEAFHEYFRPISNTLLRYHDDGDYDEEYDDNHANAFRGKSILF